ncbi:MAG: iron chelate uptake ABC transporter family permease subunit, partial [Dermabacter sp.]|nr:iron chelate uptake ABC transporter family permease subunit [Dermabacter sp.]
CGLIMQLLTQNKFVEPSTTGTTEWASLGLIAVMILFPTAGLVPRMVGAIIFALIGTLVFFGFLERVSLKSSLIVPIVGIMLGAVVGSLTTFIALETDTLQSLGIWFTGSLTGLVRGRYELLFLVLLVLVAAFIVADRFTVAGLGKDVATNVGLNYRAVVFLGVFLVAVATGIVTVIVGRLPFRGLIVPNMVSMIRGDDLRSNLPWVMLLGVWVVTVCDLIARTIIAPFEIPVSVVLGIIGAAVFLVLIVRRNRRGR